MAHDVQMVPTRAIPRLTRREGLSFLLFHDPLNTSLRLRASMGMCFISRRSETRSFSSIIPMISANYWWCSTKTFARAEGL